ncbi:MAG: PAS domain S-box protein [Bacteriovoracaceae bacterium]|nr:PAS domain S-box protein [Bacteriovoracaceae bacterium]
MNGRKHRTDRPRENPARPGAQAGLGDARISLDKLFDFLPDPTFAIDTCGRVILWNKAAEELLGVKAEDILGKKNYEYAVPLYGIRRPVLADLIIERGKDAEKNYPSLIRKDDTVHAEWHVQTPKGPVYIMGKASPIYDASGKIIGAIETIRDISDRVRREAEIRSREMKYRDIFENVSDLLYVHDLKGRFIESNLTFKTEYGYTGDDLEHLTIRDLMPEEHRHLFEDYLGRLLDSGRNEGFMNVLTKSGEPRILEYRNSLIRDEHGRPVSVRGSARDITERVLAVNGLRQSEQRFRAMAEASPVVFWMTSPNPVEKVVYASPAFEKIFGYPCAELYRNPGSWFECVHPQDKHQVMQIIRGDRKDAMDFECRIVRPDGAIRWIRLKASPVIDHEGNTVMLSGITEDITETKHAEQDKKIYEERLARAQKLEAIGTLAGGIAHDFNNILSIIIGYTELALDEAREDGTVERCLKEVLRAGDRAKDLVDQILTFSRQARTEKKPVHVQLIVKEAMKLLRSSFPSTIAITLDIDPNTPAVFADPTQIHQVVMNLCTNAYQAMLDSGGTLAVSMAPVEMNEACAQLAPRISAGSYLKLTVSDTGHGMSKETMRRIFDPFFTTRAIGRGTGLGLATVHGIVSDLSGAISVSSTPGKGSIFEVYLPAFHVGHEEKTDHEHPPHPGNGERILIVDDESALLMLARNMIEQMGYSVTVSSSGSEALQVFSRDPDAFDLVITDQTMPLLIGIDLTCKLLAIRNDIPVILVTGCSEAVSPEQARKKGVKVYLEKPFTRKALADAISRALSTGPVHASETRVDHMHDRGGG